MHRAGIPSPSSWKRSQPQPRLLRNGLALKAPSDAPKRFSPGNEAPPRPASRRDQQNTLCQDEAAEETPGWGKRPAAFRLGEQVSTRCVTCQGPSGAPWGPSPVPPPGSLTMDPFTSWYISLNSSVSAMAAGGGTRALGGEGG